MLSRISRRLKHYTAFPQTAKPIILDDGSFLYKREAPATISSEAQLPPPTRPFKIPGTKVTKENRDEMIRLRKEDPVKWTVAKLAEKFQCPPLYIIKNVSLSDCGQEGRSRREKLEKETEEKWEKTGLWTKIWKVDRARRKLFLH